MKTIFKNKTGEVLNLELIKNQYFSYILRNDIAKYHKCSWQQIDKIIKICKWNRPFKYKYSLDENYFSSINNEEKCYFLGFLLADGTVSKKGNSLSITLQESDRHIIERFKLQLKSESPIRFIENKKPNQSNYVNITFYSKKLCDDLIKLGCINNKSYLLKWNLKNIPDNFLHHFIRGYFDGDGCFCYRLHKGKYLKSTLNFTSTLDFCCGLSDLIKEKFGYNTYLSQRHKNNSNNRTIEISGNIQNQTFIKWMYMDANIFLERKKKRIDDFLQFYDSRKRKRF